VLAAQQTGTCEQARRDLARAKNIAEEISPDRIRIINKLLSLSLSGVEADVQ
jgi:hypothetical protein